MRNMVGAWMMFQATTYVGEVGDKDFVGYAVGAFAAASGVFLLFGFLTPIVSVVAFGWSLKVAWLTLSSVGIYPAGPLFRPGIVAIAIALIGPGAFSVDSRLFGRRQIIIPRGE